MKRFGGLALALMLVAGCAALAGEKSYKKCTDDTQTCLNQMVAKLQGRGWLGIEMDESGGPKAITVTRVVAGSPAEAAGFRVRDVLVSVNGYKYADNTDDKCVVCEGLKDKWTPGARIQYVVSRDGTDVSLTPTLAPLPKDVLAQWVGMHMLEHAKVDVAQK